MTKGVDWGCHMGPVFSCGAGGAAWEGSMTARVGHQRLHGDILLAATKEKLIDELMKKEKGRGHRDTHPETKC